MHNRGQEKIKCRNRGLFIPIPVSRLGPTKAAQIPGAQGPASLGQEAAAWRFVPPAPRAYSESRTRTAGQADGGQGTSRCRLRPAQCCRACPALWVLWETHGLGGGVNFVASNWFFSASDFMYHENSLWQMYFTVCESWNLKGHQPLLSGPRASPLSGPRHH